MTRKAQVPIEQKLVLSTSEISALTGICLDHIYAALRTGDLPSLDVGNIESGRRQSPKWMVTRAALDKWLERRTKKVG